MNIIEYLGSEFEVDDWANYVAADGDGSVYAFSTPPELYDSDHPEADGYVYVRSSESHCLAKWVGNIDPDIPKPESGYFPVMNLNEESSPAVNALVAALHSGAIKALTLFAPPDTETRFFVGDVVRFKGSKRQEVIAEVNLYNGAVEYSTTESSWHKGSEFELVELSSEQTRAKGYQPTSAVQKRRHK